MTEKKCLSNQKYYSTKHFNHRTFSYLHNTGNFFIIYLFLASKRMCDYIKVEIFKTEHAVHKKHILDVLVVSEDELQIQRFENS